MRVRHSTRLPATPYTIMSTKRVAALGISTRCQRHKASQLARDLLTCTCGTETNATVTKVPSAHQAVLNIARYQGQSISKPFLNVSESGRSPSFRCCIASAPLSFQSWQMAPYQCRTFATATEQATQIPAVTLNDGTKLPLLGLGMYLPPGHVLSLSN